LFAGCADAPRRSEVNRPWRGPLRRLGASLLTRPAQGASPVSHRHRFLYKEPAHLGAVRPHRRFAGRDRLRIVLARPLGLEPRDRCRWLRGDGSGRVLWWRVPKCDATPSEVASSAMSTTPFKNHCSCFRATCRRCVMRRHGRVGCFKSCAGSASRARELTASISWPLANAGQLCRRLRGTELGHGIRFAPSLHCVMIATTRRTS
jgi:hypothetical protein